MTGIVMAVALLLSLGVQAQTKGSGAAASSKEKAEAKAHYDQGTVHFNLDEWPQAIEEFKAAYRVYPDATFLYNIGQCHRKMGNAAEALSFYKKYLRERPGAPNRAEVEKRIDELEASKAAAPVVVPPPVAPAPAATAPAAVVPAPVVQPEPTVQPAPQPAAPAAAPTPSEPRVPGIGSAAPPVAVSTPAGVDVSTTAPAAEAPPSGSIFGKWWFWTAVGVVVVAGGVGTFFALSGTKSAKHYQGDMDPPVIGVH